MTLRPSAGSMRTPKTPEQELFTASLMGAWGNLLAPAEIATAWNDLYIIWGEETRNAFQWFNDRDGDIMSFLGHAYILGHAGRAVSHTLNLVNRLESLRNRTDAEIRSTFLECGWDAVIADRRVMQRSTTQEETRWRLFYPVRDLVNETDGRRRNVGMVRKKT